MVAQVSGYNPFAARVKENPYPYYDWLRREAPVYYSQEHGFFVVSRYADVSAVLKNPIVFSSAKGIGPEKSPGIPMMITNDPPVHTRLRSLVNKVFTPRMVAQLEPRIEAICNELIDAVVQQGSFDLVQEFAYPLPVIMIAEILGVEPSQRDNFKRWSDDVIHSLAGSAHGHDQMRMMQSMAEFAAYFGSAIEERRRAPKADLISALVAAHGLGEGSLSTGEMVAFCLLLLVAGNETTTNLIGNGALALMQNPEQVAKLRARPALIPSAVEEALRYDAPIQCFFRTTSQETVLHDVMIPADSKVLVSYAAANRDPDQFSDPDRFDIERAPNNHLAFGLGIHFCLGAPLARLEGQVAARTLLQRLHNLRPDPARPQERIDNPLLRGLKHFPVLFEAAE